MNSRGQGALEYLLLIGGAVLVAAIVIALITGIPPAVNPPACETGCAASTVRAVADDTICPATVLPTDCTRTCTWDTVNNICYYPTG